MNREGRKKRARERQREGGREIEGGRGSNMAAGERPRALRGMACRLLKIYLNITRYKTI